MAKADCCDLYIVPVLNPGLVNKEKEQGFNR